MKKTFLLMICVSAIQICSAQLHSGTKATPLPAQPVPASTATEKSAPTPKPLNAPVANPVPPIYPGGDVKLVETQRETVFPATTSSPTQPAQREPLTPIDATNVLRPTRPQRDEASRSNNRSIPVQRTGRPTGIQQANVSEHSSVIENPHNRKPIVSRTNVSVARTNRKLYNDQPAVRLKTTKTKNKMTTVNYKKSKRVSE